MTLLRQANAPDMVPTPIAFLNSRRALVCLSISLRHEPSSSHVISSIFFPSKHVDSAIDMFKHIFVHNRWQSRGSVKEGRWHVSLPFLSRAGVGEPGAAQLHHPPRWRENSNARGVSARQAAAGWRKRSSAARGWRQRGRRRVKNGARAPPLSLPRGNKHQQQRHGCRVKTPITIAGLWLRAHNK